MNEENLDEKVMEKDILVFNDEPVDLEIYPKPRYEFIPNNLPSGLKYHINKILEQYEQIV